MRRILSLLASFGSVGGQGLQKPLADPDRPWRLNFSSSAPHLFASTYTLLQQWSNTVFPNGHSIAPCEISAYTLFYHGRIGDDTPPSPEWLAFDIEMAYGIMGSTRNSFMLTYQTTRPVKCVYFDGESAALMGLGQLDTQMLHLYGNVTGPPMGNHPFAGLWPEYARATGLCDWLEEKGLRGRGWGFEGVVRMNAGFEMIWCDFMSDSLRLLTRLNVTAPQLPVNSDKEEDQAASLRWEIDEGRSTEARDGQTSYQPLPPRPTRTDRSSSPTNPPVPPNWRYFGPFDREPFLRSQAWAWFLSATYHYGSSRAGPGLGEARARILSCGILSYYSPSFVNQSLNRAIDERKRLNLTEDGVWKGAENRTVGLKDLGRRRRFHHLEGVSPQEARLMTERTEAALRSVLEGGACSGADWSAMMNEMVQRTVGYLKALEQHLGSFPRSTKNSTIIWNWLTGIRDQSHAFMVGFLEYPGMERYQGEESTPWRTDSALYGETYSRCRFHYTRLFEDVDLLPAEHDLLWAVEETFGTICRVLLTVGFEAERAWLDSERSRAKSRPSDLAVASQRWTDDVAELIAWLGWEGEYLSCKKVCAWNEACYIPMWPLSMWRGYRPQWNGTYPYPRRPNRPYGYGYGSTPPRFSMPPRGPAWMGDDTELWQPECMRMEYMMGG